MDAINGVTLEKYAELCALMADTGTDTARQTAIAEENGVKSADWEAAKAGFTAKMSDPADMGKTALAFMPLMQAAQTRMRGGKEPCTLETYAKVHAEMANRKDPADSSKKIDYMVVLAENGFTQPKWLECESYWTPVVVNDPTKPELGVRFNQEKAARFAELIQKESDRVLGIVR
jgi:hypothetical protein